MTIVDRPAGNRPARPLAALLTVLALVAASLVAATPAQAITWAPKICVGFRDCDAKGLGNAGYEAVHTRSFWHMTAGHNCTNYVAYRLQQRGIPNFLRAWHGNGGEWGHEARLAGYAVDRNDPRPGDVAWWDKNVIAGSTLGHVAYVEKVDLKAGTFTVSEDNYRGDFDWRTYRISEVSGFIHTAKPWYAASPVPIIAGTVRVGQTLSARPGSWLPSGVTFRYQWIRDDVWIDGAKGATYTLTPADAGKRIRVKVTGTKAGYNTVNRWSGEVAVPLQQMTSTPVPTVAGTAKVGQTVTARTGTWAPSGIALSYQWRRDEAWIPGARSASYRLTPEDAGRRISVKVTGQKATFATVARYSADVAVPLQQLGATPTPVISGTPRTGQVLTAKPGTWQPSGVTLSYQWIRDGVWISGARSSTYRLTDADAGAVITVKVTGAKPTYASVSKWSAGVAVPLQSLASTPTPTIAGTAAVGSTLTARPGTWQPSGVALSYQWIRDGVWISGARSSTYRLTEADAGSAITVKVTGSRLGYKSVAKWSAATAVPALKTFTAPVPKITGTPKAGATLTAVPGTWSPAPAALSYQWIRDGVWISGAKGRTYVLQAADVGRKITVKVTGSQAGYRSLSKWSAATAAVAK